LNLQINNFKINLNELLLDKKGYFCHALV
jgi:hypothetical protein